MSSFTASASAMVGDDGFSAPGSTTPVASADDIIANMEEFYFQQAQGAIEAGLAWGSFFTMAASMHVLAALAGNSNVDGAKFKQYVRDFLPGYDADAMWHCLRCGLFHAGGGTNAGSTVAGVLNVVVTSDAGSHDPDGSKKVNAGCVTIDASSLLEDLRKSLGAVLSNRLPNAIAYYQRLHPSTV